MQIKENKQLKIQQKQNCPGLVASYDTQPGNEVGLFYNGPEHPHGPRSGSTKKGRDLENGHTTDSFAQ